VQGESDLAEAAWIAALAWSVLRSSDAGIVVPLPEIS